MAKQQGGGSKVVPFEAWVQATKGRPSQAQWTRWSKAALDEVEAVLAMNDAGEAAVSQYAMIRRLADAHGIVTTKPGMEQLMRHWGRTWTTKPGAK
jgi:hypothetical protein